MKLHILTLQPKSVVCKFTPKGYNRVQSVKIRDRNPLTQFFITVMVSG